MNGDVPREELLLLFDIGNTSVALATLAPLRAGRRAGDGGNELGQRTLSLVDLPARAAGGSDDVLALDGPLAAFVRAAAPGTRAFTSNVARPARAARLDDLLLAAGLAPASINVQSGLGLALVRPETCGFDRQYAARAGLARAGGEAALVVGVGTAMTVDAVVGPRHPRARAAHAAFPHLAARPGPLAGVFLGGAIAPGPRLLAEALARGGARLFEVETLVSDVPALGNDSAAALRSGVVHGLAGAALELVARVGAESGLGDAPVWLTGGAAPLVEGALRRVLGSRLGVARGLVLEGLGAAASEARP